MLRLLSNIKYANISTFYGVYINFLIDIMVKSKNRFL